LLAEIAQADGGLASRLTDTLAELTAGLAPAP
jgi:hypothetical protein